MHNIQLIPLGRVSIPTLFNVDLISADNRFIQSQGKNWISLSTNVGQKIADWVWVGWDLVQPVDRSNLLV